MAMRLILGPILALVFLSGVRASPPQEGTALASGLTTLYACDPLCRTFSIKDGTYGSIVQGGVVKNCDSHIEFLSENGDVLNVGVQGGNRGAIVDLGSAIEFAAKYHVPETVGNVQGFARIRHQVEGFVGYGGLLAENAALATVKVRAAQAVKYGHIYLARISRDDPKESDLWAKLLVVGYIPGQMVTLRWESL